MSRYAHFLLSAVFSIVLLATHRGQVYVDLNHKDTSICTAYDTPTWCWDEHHGGPFRAMNFVAPSTTLSFSNFNTGTIYNPDGSSKTLTSLPYSLYFDPVRTLNHTQDWCAKKFYNGHKKTVDACKAERIQNLYEIPNADQHREIWTISGGVHIWYFIWISLWLSTSFSLVMVPAGADAIKLPLLLLWHFLGVLFSVLMFVNDDYFNMHLPLNNMLLGIMLEVVTVMVQLYWARVSHSFWELKNPTNHPLQARMGSAPAKRRHPKASGGLMSLMKLNMFGGDNEFTDYTDGSSGPYGPVAVDGVIMEPDDEAIIAPDNSSLAATKPAEKPRQYVMEVYTAKYYLGELLEAMFMEAAITLPPALLAVFCMGSRVNFDWMLQALYMRAVFVFLMISICYKTTKFVTTSNASLAEKNELILTMVIFSIMSMYLAFFFLYDWFEPVVLNMYAWRGIYSSNVRGITYFLFIVMCIIIPLFLLVSLIKYMIYMWNMKRVPNVVEGQPGHIVEADVVFGKQNMAFGPRHAHVPSHMLRPGLGTDDDTLLQKANLRVARDFFVIERVLWYVAQLLLVVFRVLLFVYGVGPYIWYEHYDKKDVVFNYPLYGT